MDSHSRAYNHHPFGAKPRYCLSESVVHVWVFLAKQRDLHEGNVEWVFIVIEHYRLVSFKKSINHE
jgi:hypothetical protein